MPLTVVEAEQELTQAIALEQEIAGELAAVAGKLSEAESTTGARSLEARKAGDQKAIQKINDEILKLKNQHEVLSKTHQAARTAILEARREVNKAGAAVLRAEAEEILNLVNERQQRTNKLLAALFEHEGIHYQPEPQIRGGVYLQGSVAESKTAKLAKDASFLIEQAKITENQIVRVEPDAPVTGRVSNAQSG